MSHADVIQLGVPQEAHPDTLLADLRRLAERHGWLFRNQTHVPSLVPSITKYKGERLWFVWEKDNRPKDIDKISMDLAALELEQIPMKFLEIKLRNRLFDRPAWWSEDHEERAEARAFAASFLSLIEAVIGVASPTHGVGERDDIFTQDQYNTTILPPAEDLVASILRNELFPQERLSIPREFLGEYLRKPHPPWIVYFGPDLVQTQGEQIRRLGAVETRIVSGGILAVFRTNPTSAHDLSPEELRGFREEVEPILRAELRRRSGGESAPPL